MTGFPIPPGISVTGWMSLPPTVSWTRFPAALIRSPIFSSSGALAARSGRPASIVIVGENEAKEVEGMALDMTTIEDEFTVKLYLFGHLDV